MPPTVNETSKFPEDHPPSETLSSLAASPDDVVLASESVEVEERNNQYCPHKSICMVGCNKNLINVEVTINDNITSAVVDSGSVSSLISHDLALKLGLDVHPCKEDEEEMRGFGDNVFKVLGVALCPLILK